jgi:hypothetical protein
MTWLDAAMESSSNPDEPLDRFLDPLHERETRGHQGYVQTLVDIVGLFAGMLLVRIEQHGAVAVDAAAEEVGKIFLWYAERSESEALGGHEPMTPNQSCKMRLLH